MALVAVLGVAVGVAGLVIRDGASEGAAPEQVVRDFLSAQDDLDCERLTDLVSDRFIDSGGGRRETLEDCEDSRSSQEETSDEDLASILATVETTSVDDGRATVTYSASGDIIDELDPVTIEVALVDDDGAWKVDAFLPVTGDLPEDSPQAAARDHAQALLDGDCHAYLAVLSAEALAELGDTPRERSGECEQLVGPGASVSSPRLGPVVRDSQTDDRAVVGVTVFSDSYEAGNTIFHVAVIEEDGTWKVDQLDWSDDPESTAD